MTPKPCSTGKRRFAKAWQAWNRLDEILENPSISLNALYMPTGVRSCPKCRGFHLTSKMGKRWAKGKKAQDLRVPRRY